MDGPLKTPDRREIQENEKAWGVLKQLAFPAMEVLVTFGFLTSLAESACRFFSGLEILPTAFLSVKFNFEPLESCK